MPTRIFIADNQAEVRSAIHLQLLQEPGRWHVVGESTCLRHLLAAAPVLRPDILLFDWELPTDPNEPHPSHPQVLQKIQAHLPDCLLIALSARPEARCEALSGGVYAFISKSDPPETLLSQLAAAEKHLQSYR
jgi:DNA-binding NarL/FixJ family response regulator